MKKISFAFSIILVSLLSVTNISAKCFGFSDADIKVCVNGDSNAARKKAGDICKKAVGAKCGNITGYSGSCNGTKCYDESGNKKNSIKVD